MIDLAIIGTGPAALTAAIYAARDGLKVVLFEKSAVGGLVITSELIENYPGFPDGISGYELGQNMRKQAERFGAEIRYGEVTSIQGQADNSVLIIDSEQIEARSVLLAPGNSYRRLNINKEADFIGRGIHFCATCDGPFYKGQEIVAVGGGDTAVEDSLFLSRFSKVKLIVRSKIRAQEILQKKLKQAEADGKIEVYLNAEIEQIVENSDDETRKVDGVIVRQNGKKIELKIPAIFEFIGLIPNTEFLESTQIDLTKSGEIIVDNNYMTNLPGVFAAGDAIKDAQKQLIIAAASGADAAIKIREFLNKNND
ncbi:FAD-dependent oxidoreductase [Candidatus Saccharibacteria bacterium]|nr:FAD-dependent oxidoreductase [Candidatus Saccharibacteria bacterium]MBP9489630.1 FAD-dependent oxidoreductase [Candidatus Saccharibacteria bacterium]